MAKTKSRRRAHAAKRAAIANQKGLHARAAAKFVKLAAEFDADITVAKDDIEVSGLSIMGLMMLAAGPGMELEIRARGRQATKAVNALVGLVKSGFAED
ncbi:MAG: HPr family phosphocarrier protein [Alphaproteobacteria bacterium]